MKICVVVGTRPEIVKMAPIIHELKNRHLDFSLVHTGQHYDHDLSQVFFEELDLPQVAVGDRVYFVNAGAYTLAYASHFNGWPPPEVHSLPERT